METSTREDMPAITFAVMGATGTGKSTFINLLTNDDEIHVGHNQDSQTLDIQMARYVDNTTGRSVALIDTPGFDDSREGVTDTDILEKIVQFLEPGPGRVTPLLLITLYSQPGELCREGRKLNGVIYMHRISDPRVGGASRKNLRMFHSLCGAENLVSVRIVTTNWNRVSEQEGDYREADLKRGAFKAVLEAGAQIRRHTSTIESAQQIMSELIPLPPVTMQIQTELREGKKLAETAAGMVLAAEMREIQKRHEKDLANLKREMEEAAKANDLALRTELEQERNALEEKMERANADRKRLGTTLEESHAGVPSAEHGIFDQLDDRSKEDRAVLTTLQAQTEQLKAHVQDVEARIHDLEKQEHRMAAQMSGGALSQVTPDERARFERLMEQLSGERKREVQQVECNRRRLQRQEEEIHLKQLELQLRLARTEELETKRERYGCLIC